MILLIRVDVFHQVGVHISQELDYKISTDNPGFNLGKDGIDDDNDQHDLVVSVTSQLDGLPYQIRQSGSDSPNNTAVNRNTVNASFMIKDDKEVLSKTKSPYIQEDIIRLLNSSDDNNKFANAIGIGSPCNP